MSKVKQIGPRISMELYEQVMDKLDGESINKLVETLLTKWVNGQQMIPSTQPQKITIPPEDPNRFKDFLKNSKAPVKEVEGNPYKITKIGGFDI